MAKKKRQTTPAREVKEVTRATSAAVELTHASLFLPGGKLTLKGYVILNVLFDAFCVFQLLFIRFTLHETRGLYFFFGLLMIGFLVVSIYDYVYDRLVPATPETE